mmetsp:Transcript_8295/g.12269  ORF Transcript_8295/g.12269 Transcript_8295/m.12269 type:complete len:425 (-) Transcript_8295:418-1692(-)|eukprot:CAMPEP_0184737822 /NCGR_PEP_ID=MMETSP0315-20130426/592_1 /TAXON_ID=101924 /ORGANISM="Rhodosorus marinus, Strain UTEX LB 2760" /LENGTH=424 /DNA_ID=CAMNT_0027205235 /DNA_START=176 /DNA_END=1450 /DNA_ORIENTATION=-
MTMEIGHQHENGRRKPVRVYMDGCFDMMHFGHANALRQAKSLGDVLVVGICPDEEIRRNKGPPVMNNDERLAAVESVKWVDEIITDVPYDVTSDFLRTLIEDHGVDFIVHGDDPCLGPDGRDVYAAVKEQKKFRTVKRTEGVSSTDILDRIMRCSGDLVTQPAKMMNGENGMNEMNGTNGTNGLKGSNGTNGLKGSNGTNTMNGTAGRKKMNGKNGTNGMNHGSPFHRPSTFLPTTRRLLEFVGNSNIAKANGVNNVVYVDGAFDMFHAGHIAALREAKKHGDFVLVGIHDDITVNSYKGGNFPIMNLHERVLSVLSSKYVNEVIIGAPLEISEDMIKTMNISMVVHGVHQDKRLNPVDPNEQDPYKVPKQLGIFQEIDSKSELSVHDIVRRITQKRDQYEKRNEKKVAQEQVYLQNKEYVEEL